MKTNLLRILSACLLAVSGASCSTAYDAYGRPHTVVDPGAAALGAAAAGVAGYAIARNRYDNDHDHHRHYRHYGHGRRYYY
jgi:hypothetical protein